MLREGMEDRILVSTPVQVVDDQRNAEYMYVENREAGSARFMRNPENYSTTENQEAGSARFMRNPENYSTTLRRSVRDRKPPDYFNAQVKTLYFGYIFSFFLKRFKEQVSLERFALYLFEM